MCVLSIKVPIQKKSGTLFNDLRIYLKQFCWRKNYSVLNNSANDNITKKQLIHSLSLSSVMRNLIVIFNLKHESIDSRDTGRFIFTPPLRSGWI